MEMTTDLYIIIIGIIALIIMFSILLKFYPAFEREEAVGEPDVVAKKIAKLAMECWSNHRAGLDTKSEVCFSIDVKTGSVISELMFTQYLNCEQLPNSACDGGACACTSQFYQDQDKVRWLVQNSNTTLKISYDGNAKKISVLDVLAVSNCFNGVQDAGETGTDCGGDCTACLSDAALCQAEESKDGCASIPQSDAAACCRERSLCCSAVTTSTVPVVTTTLASSLCDVDDIVNSVDKNAVYDYLNTLASDARPAEGWGVDTSYNKQTRDYIRDKLVEFGLSNVHIESFTYTGGTGYNVVGELGSGSRQIVIGAHRDSVPAGPGAVDNGAGTATVMEIARIFASKCEQFVTDNDYRIIFALFDSEEIGIGTLGSRAYVRDNSVSNTNVRYMLNFDCTSGYTNDVGMVAWVTNNRLSTATDTCGSRFALPIEKTFNSICPVGGSCSDYAPFRARGIPIAFPADKAASGELCAGGFPAAGGVLHSSSDTMTVVDRDKLVWGAKYGMCLLREII